MKAFLVLCELLTLGLLARLLLHRAACRSSAC